MKLERASWKCETVFYSWNEYIVYIYWQRVAEHVLSCALHTSGSLVFSSVLKQDEKTYKCEAYNYVVRQTTGGSYHRIIVQQGM